MDNKHNQNNLDQEISTSGTHISSDGDISVASSLSQPPKPKQGVSKKTFVLTIIFTLLFTACVTSVIWYFVTTNNTNNNANFVNNCAELTEPEDTETDVTEVEITDVATKQELDRKLNLLHLMDENDIKDTVGQSGVNYQVFMDSLYSNEDSCIATALYWLNKDKATIAADGRSVIEVSDVEAVCQDLYGIIPEHETFGAWEYDSSTDTYVGAWMLGGVVPSGFTAYKTKYTSEGDKAYIYADIFSYETTLGEDRTKSYYKGYIPASDFEYDSDGQRSVSSPDLTISYEEDEAPELTDSQRVQVSAPYRFVFEKAPDGSYYFDSVEKL